MSTQQDIDTARAFLRALERFDTERLQQLVASDAQRIELPNRLKPDGSKQDAAQMFADAARAETVIKSQFYDVTRIAAAQDLVMMELVWTGTLAVDIGTLSAGDKMTAHCVAAFDFKDGKISGLRNYDCFEAF